MKTTVAIVNQQGDDFALQEVELDGPRDDEILVRIVATGLCHTDIHLKDTLPEAMFPRVFGHEGAGVVRPSARKSAVLRSVTTWCSASAPVAPAGTAPRDWSAIAQPQ